MRAEKIPAAWKRPGSDQEGEFPMEKTLAETMDLLPALGGQAALFDDPELVLLWDEEFLRTVAANIGRSGGSILAQLRRAAGLVAWAGWFRFGDGEYGAFLDGIADNLGVDRRTVERWRNAVIDQEGLARPALAAQRATEAKKRPKAAGQRGYVTTLPSPSPAIPVASTEVKTTADPAPMAEIANEMSGGVDAGPAPGLASPTAPDPTPEGAGVTVESPPLAPSGSSSVPTVKQLLRTLHTLLDEIDPTEAFNVESEDQRERHAQWIKRYRSTAAQEPSPAPAKRRQGTVSRPEDRAKAKLEVVPVDPSTCDHPKEKRKKLAYGNLCERCGRMVA